MIKAVEEMLELSADPKRLKATDKRPLSTKRDGSPQPQRRFLTLIRFGPLEFYAAAAVLVQRGVLSDPLVEILIVKTTTNKRDLQKDEMMGSFRFK